MKTIACIAIAGMTSVVWGEVLLVVDLSDPGFITITATDGLSAGTVSGDTSIGFLLANFFNDASFAAGDTLVSGNLTSALDISDGSPDLWSWDSGLSASFGLNVYNYTQGPTTSFRAGTVAFSGSATWAIDAPEYAAMLDGNTNGDIYAIADADTDLPNATLLGQWHVIPAPGTMALLGFGGVVVGRRRR